MRRRGKFDLTRTYCDTYLTREMTRARREGERDVEDYSICVLHSRAYLRIIKATVIYLFGDRRIIKYVDRWRRVVYVDYVPGHYEDLDDPISDLLIINRAYIIDRRNS